MLEKKYWVVGFGFNKCLHLSLGWEMENAIREVHSWLCSLSMAHTHDLPLYSTTPTYLPLNQNLLYFISWVPSMNFFALIVVLSSLVKCISWLQTFKLLHSHLFPKVATEDPLHYFVIIFNKLIWLPKMFEYFSLALHCLLF